MTFSGRTFAVGAAALSSLVAADSASKLDVTTFSKLVKKQSKVPAKDDTMIVHFKKKYGYDSAEITDKVTLATQKAEKVTVFDLEIPDKLDEEEDSENSEESADSEDSQSDWKIKEKREKEMARETVKKFDIQTTKLPYIGVFRAGKQVASYDVGEDGKAEDAMNWLEARGIPLVLEQDADIAAFDEILSKFAAKDAKTDDFKALLPAVQSVIDDEFSLDEEKKTKAGAFLKSLTNAAKQADGAGVRAYCEKEGARLGSIVESGAVGAEKKKEMRAKISILKALAGKLAPTSEESTAEL